MDVYPLKQIDVVQAKEKQFVFVDEISKEFTGKEFLSLGDLGVVQPANKPETTAKVERVLAKFFHAEKAILVTGAGTGAIRYALTAMLPAGGNILVHKAPPYPTTLTTLEGLQANLIEADFNDLEELKHIIKTHTLDGALVQITRQKPNDSYQAEEVIQTIKACKDIPILTDDNYTIMRVPAIGVELGADMSAFSAFKVLGPEGVGVIVGKAKWIDRIEKMNYSGGGKVQGWQAMECLRMFTYAPVALAIQAEEVEKAVQMIKEAQLPKIKQVFIASAQSKIIIVEFYEDIASDVLKEAEKLGAAPNPVGAESKYEVLPMFYKVSGTFIKHHPQAKSRMIRINPMRSGASTVVRILTESVKRV